MVVLVSYCIYEPLTEKLLSCYFHCCWVDFMFGLLDCVCYNKDLIISRFCFVHVTVTLAEQKNIVRYTEDFVI